MRHKTIIFCIGITAFALVASCNKAEPNAPDQSALPFPVIKVEKRDVTTHTAYPASIEGVTNSDVRAKVSGYIREVLADEGQNVRKGQVLFRLETESLSQDAEAAKALVNAAQVEVDRLAPLVDKGIIGGSQLETAKANLAQAKSTYSSITANIGYATIRSPIDGVVGSIPYRTGNLVSATDAAPLTTVSQIDRMFAYFSMNEKDFIAFNRNTEGRTLQEKAANMPPVQLQLADGSTYEEPGAIETITGEIDRQTGSVSFRASFPNPSGILRNGSSGTLLLPRKYEGALIIPELSVVDRQGKKFVYRVADNDSVYSAAITPMAETGNLLILSNGLNENDRILGQGVGKATPGMTISPQPTTIDSIVNSFEAVR